MIDHSQGVVYRNSVGLVLVGECLPTLERPSVWADLPFSYVFARIRAYLSYGEPEGGKPSALYQNPGTISLFDRTRAYGPWALGPRARALGPGPRAPGPGPRAPSPGPRAPAKGDYAG